MARWRSEVSSQRHLWTGGMDANPSDNTVGDAERETGYVDSSF